MLDEEDNEESVRNSIRESVIKKLPIISPNDFEFVKVWQKKITRLELGPNTEYSYSVVKKMAGQGLLYVKVREGFEFIYGESSEDLDDNMLQSPFENLHKSDATDPTGATEDKNGENEVDVAPVQHTAELLVTHQGETTGRLCESDISAQLKHDEEDLCDSIIRGITDLTDPVEILKFLQQHLVKGRQLDIAHGVDSRIALDPKDPQNATNYICVDCASILTTTFAEFQSIQDFSITFEVDFMGEVARDYGGPRKEWIPLMNSAMKEKYFDNGLRELLFEDYYHVGLMMGIALLQNGQLPTILPADIIESLTEEATLNACITNLKRGLNKFGLVKIFKFKPTLLHLLRPSNTQLTARIVIQLLNPVFSPEGSTALSREKEVYSLFIKYIRQVASGRRPPLTLSSILVFVTGAAEEPVLGFTLQPSITFVNERGNDQVSWH